MRNVLKTAPQANEHSKKFLLTIYNSKFNMLNLEKYCFVSLKKDI